MEAVEQQRRALTDRAAAEPADRLVDADGGGVLVEFDHDIGELIGLLERVGDDRAAREIWRRWPGTAPRS